MTIIRGATTITRNNIEEMQVAVLEMYDKIIQTNNLDLSKIACIVFVCTKDLTCGNPATLLRTNRDKVSNIPLMSLAHHEYKKALKKMYTHYDCFKRRNQTTKSRLFKQCTKVKGGFK